MNKKTKETTPAQGAEAVNGATPETPVREIGKHLPAITKKAMNLPQVIKTIDELHQIIRHRDRLELYEGQLADFDIARKEEDLEEKGYYSGCILTLVDDQRNEFKLKNPVLIKDVTDFLRGKMLAKRLELEAKIVIPAA